MFNIRGDYDETQFTDLFREFGEIEVAYFVKYKDKENKYHGFVTFTDQASAQRAIQTSFFMYNGFRVKIKKFTLNSKKFQLLQHKKDISSKKQLKIQALKPLPNLDNDQSHLIEHQQNSSSEKLSLMKIKSNLRNFKNYENMPKDMGSISNPQ